MSTAGPVDRLALALDATGELIAGVRSDQWTNPTPCPEWNVRALVNHLVVGGRIHAATVRGEPQARLEQLRQSRDVDQLGDNPVQAFREAGEELVSAFGQASVLERVFQAPVGHVPGAVLLHLRTTDILVHGWDLAQATGQPARLPGDIAEEELAFARSPHAPNVPRTGHPFGPIQPVAENAPAIDRLAAYLGRVVTITLPRADRL